MSEIRSKIWCSNEKLAVFGKVMDVEENLNAGRSGFLTILSHPDIVIVPATSPFVILFARYGIFSKEVEDGCAEPDPRRHGSNPQTYGRFLETSTRKFAVFGKVMDVEKNLNAGLSRSVFITYYTQAAIRSALNFPEPIFLNRESLKISAWRPYGAPDPRNFQTCACSHTFMSSASLRSHRVSHFRKPKECGPGREEAFGLQRH
ncbi:hypothetical protein DAPPUDRAFT_269180 [Daphnia pulex]|uniref:Uncharacterized protein n=1 Tax=Daphnia pulex TaxID=6669 RepID=E9HYY7_DAPPU|nr:hypothetical protein DAPPUDRAFT_269180 [Daphnia pulex]|eukprot:EFX63043.1 hypothetical protein DAPPUDRAFT_269180 [Daphnia pulex]